MGRKRLNRKEADENVLLHFLFRLKVQQRQGVSCYEFYLERFSILIFRLRVLIPA